MTSPRLGDYELHEPIGRGGAGLVRAGVHLPTGQPVAIKVLAHRWAEGATDAAAELRHEVRAAASLDHPHVVVVHDQGIVSADAARPEEGLDAGAPWMAMELARAPLRRVRGWTDTHRVLVALLDALAHAHARGVIHRDLKPSNILLFGEGEDHPKLSDFGMAHVVDDRALPGATSHGGTPAYMAPEQFERNARLLGPWSDLYALGCVAWTLATGRPPFRPTGLDDARRQHQQVEPPRFEPRFRVPPGLEAWLRDLLAKNAGARFQRAADAAWSLAQLPEVADPGGTVPAIGLPQQTTLILPTTEQPTDILPESGSSGPAPIRSAAVIAPPLPRAWQRRRPGRRAVSAGLGLFGLRTIPLVDRDDERTALWDALRSVHDTGRPGGLLLRGHAGSGKSRLAGWLCRRAHEVGGAVVLRAWHGETEGPSDGLSAMIARDIHAVGADRTEAEACAQRALARLGVDDPWEVASLAELAAPGLDTDAEVRVRFSGQAERHLTLTRWVRRRARARPVILWLDDVQWGVDALELARTMLRGTVPVLVVMTVREEALPSRPAAGEVLDELATHPRVRSIEVGSLPPEHLGALVRELLGLDERLIAAVERRSAGNPLFAVQLIGHWVHTGVLVPGADGLRLKEGATADLPEDLLALWRERLEELLEGRPGTEADGLEIAAVLGHVVDREEWRAAAAVAGAVASDALVEDMLGRRLAARSDEGRWSFVHAMVREALVARARAAGRLERWHGACADMLRSRDGADPGRIGHHLLAATRWEEAIEPLNRGIDRRFVSGPFSAVLPLIDALQRAMDEAGLPADDSRRGEPDHWRARYLNMSGRLEEALAASEAVRAAAEAHGWARLQALSWREASWTLSELGRLEEAEAAAREAMRLGRGGDPHLVYSTHRHAARALLMRGHLDEAETTGRVVLDAARQLSEQHVGEAWGSLGQILLVLDRPEQARSCLERSAAAARDLGRLEAWGAATNSLGEIARRGGDLVTAEGHYREALEVFTRLGSGLRVYPRLNLGLVLVQQGRHDDARRHLEPLAVDLEREGRRLLAASAELALAVIEAAEGRWAAFDARWGPARDYVVRSGTAEEDIAELAERIATVAGAGSPERARDAWRLAARMWEMLERTERAQGARRRATRPGG